MDELSKKEEKKLKNIQDRLTPDQIEEIGKNTQELKKRQESTEDFSCLPTLTIDDIPKSQPKVEMSFTDLKIPEKSNQSHAPANVNLQFSPQPTNDLAYFSLLTEIPELEPELLPYVPLFCETLGAMQTKRFSHHELAQQLESYTGGAEFEPLLIQDKEGTKFNFFYNRFD